MKSKTTIFCLSVILLMLLFINLYAASIGKEILVRVELNDIEDIKSFENESFSVNLRQDNYVVVTTTSDKLNWLQEKGLRCEIIDENGWSENYYLLSRPKLNPLGQIPGNAPVLFQEDNQALIKADEKEIEKLRQAGFETFALSKTPLSLRVNKKSRLSDLEHIEAENQVITALMNQVSDAKLTEGLLRLQAFKTRFSGSDSVYAAGQWIMNQLKSYGYEDVYFDTLTVTVQGKTQRNVFAVKTGITDPDKVVIIGGHYDSIVLDGNDPLKWAPGVDDDGTGTIATMETARVLAGIDFDKTIMFALWAAEEQGLYGSTDWVNRIRTTGLDIELYINFDMIGNLDQNDPIRNLSIATNSTSMGYAELMAELAETHTTLVPEILNAGGGSDHVPFAQNGYNFVYGEEGDFSPNWHRGTDTIDNVDIPYFKEVTQIGLGTLATVAGAPDEVPGTFIGFSAYNMDDDASGSSLGNDNQFLDPGETIELYISLKNVGNAAVNGVSATLSSENQYITISENIKAYPDFQPGDSLQNPEPFVFSISEATPNNEPLLFSLLISDDQNNEWETFLLLNVRQSDFEFYTSEIVEISGDGDNIPEPGELLSLVVNLKNTGSRIATDISATLSSTDSDIIIVNDAVEYPDVEVGALTRNDALPFSFSIAETAKPHSVDFLISINEGGGYYSSQLKLKILIGQGAILLVVDNGSDNYIWEYQEAFNELGVPLNIWNTSEMGAVPADTLMKYSETVWYTGDDAKETLSEEERTNLQAYLDNGGHLLLSGDFIAFRLSKTDFFSDYLYAKFASFQTLLYHLNSTPENPVTNIESLELANADGNWPTEIDPIEPAFPIFVYDREAPEGPGTIVSSGTGALAVDNGTYKLVYCSFRLETITPLKDRAQLFSDVFSWFKGVPIDVKPILKVDGFTVDDDSLDASVGDGDGFWNPGETVEVALNIKNNGFVNAAGITAKIFVDDPFVTVIDSTIEIGRILMKSDIVSEDKFVLEAALDTQHKYEVAATVILMDSTGHTWDFDLEFNILFTNTIKGRIVDIETAAGIPEATLAWNAYVESVNVIPEFGSIVSDENGNFNFALPIGYYEMGAFAEGYVPSDIIFIALPPDTSLIIKMASPALSVNTDSIVVDLNVGESKEEHIELKNTGTGDLYYTIMESPALSAGKMTMSKPAPPAIPKLNLNLDKNKLQTRSLDGSMTSPDPDKWKLMYIDRETTDIAHDLNKFYIQHDDLNIWFKQTVYHPWGTPSQDFIYAIFIDTDLNTETGSQVNYIGGDFVVAVGALGNVILGYIPETGYMDVIPGNYLPHYIILSSRCDSLEVGIRRSQIGNPEKFRAMMVMLDPDQLLEDYAPKDGLYYVPYSLYDEPWLTPMVNFGKIAQGGTETISLNFNSESVEAGIHQLNLTIETNQPNGEIQYIPVRLNMDLAGVSDVGQALPKTFDLAQNFPNPFSVLNGQVLGTAIKFQLPKPSEVTLKVYNMLGQEVATIAEQNFKAGYHEVNWNGRLFDGKLIASGIYFYKIQAGDFIKTKKMVILR